MKQKKPNKFDLSIIYVYFNTPKELYDSINSLKLAVGNLSYEIIIVDNNSEKEIKIPSEKENSSKIKIIRNKINIGYGGGLNIGSKIARGEVFLMTNPDILFAPFSILKMYERINSDKKIGIIGPQILDSKNEIRRTISGSPLLPNGIFAFSSLNNIFPNNKFSKAYWLTNLDLNKEHSVTTIGGACMMMRIGVFTRINGFDERFFLFFEENDLCLRIKDIGLKVLYYPESKILHLGSRSMENAKFIEKKFEESRYKFFHKYHGVYLAALIEIFIRFVNINIITLGAILFISLFLNLYRINDLVLFIGDFGRDFLAARDMILTGQIPLVGIKSSVVWLHQGPLSVYLIGIVLLIANFNPIAPAFLYSLMGVLTTFLVYMLGKITINKQAGLFASLFYATSPLIVVSARMPYHTSPIPLVASIFFLLLYQVLRGKRILLFPTFLVLGLLLQLELANAVVFIILILLYFINRPKIYRKDLIYSSFGFLLGVIPFILHDVTNRFVYSIGFPLWIMNRIRLFLTMPGSESVNPTYGAIYRIYQQLSSAIFPSSVTISIIVVTLVLLALLLSVRSLKNLKNDNSLILITMWIIVPLIGYMIHKSPSTAYFPLIFPPLALLIAFGINYWFGRYKIILFIFIFGCLMNVSLIISNEYFLFTKNRTNFLPPEQYGYGYSIDIPRDVANFIVKNSKGRPVSIVGGNKGFQIENFNYLIWYAGGKQDSKSNLVYRIYVDKSGIPKNENIIYLNKYLFVTKNDK